MSCCGRRSANTGCGGGGRGDGDVGRADALDGSVLIEVCKYAFYCDWFMFVTSGNRLETTTIHRMIVSAVLSVSWRACGPRRTCTILKPGIPVSLSSFFPHGRGCSVRFAMVAVHNHNCSVCTVVASVSMERWLQVVV